MAKKSTKHAAVAARRLSRKIMVACLEGVLVNARKLESKVKESCQDSGKSTAKVGRKGIVYSNNMNIVN